ncbi:MAG: hypothetical protein Q7S21_03015 [archaeon]|nr:hypothetical protein [archaeon]
MRKPKNQRKFVGGFTQESKKSFQNLLSERNIRKNKVIAASLTAGTMGILVGPGASFALKLKNVFPELEAISLASGAILGIGGTLGTHAHSTPKIRKATFMVGKALGIEEKINTALHIFLGQWTYVFVNKKGELVGSRVNVPKLFGFGYIRLESKKILNGTYAREAGEI